MTTALQKHASHDQTDHGNRNAVASVVREFGRKSVRDFLSLGGTRLGDPEGNGASGYILPDGSIVAHVGEHYEIPEKVGMAQRVLEDKVGAVPIYHYRGEIGGVSGKTMTDAQRATLDDLRIWAEGQGRRWVLEKHAQHDQKLHGRREGATNRNLVGLPRHLPRSLGIKREDMPQIREDDQRKFMAYVRGKGVEIDYGREPVRNLRPAQGEYNPLKVEQAKGDVLKKPIIVSQDNYVLDGTHRWLGLLRDDRDGSAPVLRIGLDALAAMRLMHAFPASTRRDIANQPIAASVDGGWVAFDVVPMTEVLTMVTKRLRAANERMAKHATHDQKDHGNRDGGGVDQSTPNATRKWWDLTPAEFVSRYPKYADEDRRNVEAMLRTFREIDRGATRPLVQTLRAIGQGETPVPEYLRDVRVRPLTPGQVATEFYGDPEATFMADSLAGVVQTPADTDLLPSSPPVISFFPGRAYKEDPEFIMWHELGHVAAARHGMVSSAAEDDGDEIIANVFAEKHLGRRMRKAPKDLPEGQTFYANRALPVTIAHRRVADLLSTAPTLTKSASTTPAGHVCAYGVVVFASEGLEKHAQHDQKTHGNRDVTAPFTDKRGRKHSFEYVPAVRSKPMNVITVRPGPGEPVPERAKWDGEALADGVIGELRWRPPEDPYNNPTIDWVGVHPKYRRSGIAAEMLRRARLIDPYLSHSDMLSSDGRKWSDVVKHGNHDQKAHGRRGAASTATVDRLVEGNKSAVIPAEQWRGSKYQAAFVAPDGTVIGVPGLMYHEDTLLSGGFIDEDGLPDWRSVARLGIARVFGDGFEVPHGYTLTAAQEDALSAMGVERGEHVDWWSERNDPDYEDRSAVPYRFAKHADHDQDDHGNWADGTSVAERIARAPRARAPRDGEWQGQGGGSAAKKFIERDLNGLYASRKIDVSTPEGAKEWWRYFSRSVSNEEQQDIVREKVAAAIGDGIDDNEWAAMQESAKQAYGSFAPLSRHEEVRKSFDKWRETSADSDPAAVSMQLAAGSVFGLGPETADMVYRRYADYKQPEWSRKQGEELLERWVGSAGQAHQMIVRSMYQNTQKELAEHGIKEVTLYRGMMVPKSAAPEWMLKGGVGEITQQPLSSWTSDARVARDFAKISHDLSQSEAGHGVMLSATFPAERIVGTARTGFGKLPEYEWVVVGGPAEVKADVVWTADEKGKNPAFHALDDEVEKHMPGGQGHDQSRHGRPGASAPQTTARLSQRLAERDGFTYDPRRAQFRKVGYALSIHKDRERVIAKPKSADVPTLLAEYRRDNADLLRQRGKHLGAWIDERTGDLYLDVSQVVADPDEAQRMAVEHDQEAYYDLKNGVSVYVRKQERPAADRPASGGRDPGGRGGVREGDRGDAGQGSGGFRDLVRRFSDLVRKHGNDHDEADHGNWADGGSKVDAEAHVEHVYARYVASLTGTEKQYLQDYSAFGSHDLNSWLRGKWRTRPGQSARSAMSSATRALDSAIAKGKTTQAYRIYRGIDRQLDTRIHVGSVITDNAFSSFSLVRDVAERFARDTERGHGARAGTIIEVDLPAGSRAAFPDALVNEAFRLEAEVLLPRGSKFVVTDIKYDGDLRILTAKYEPPTSPPPLPRKS